MQLQDKAQFKLGQQLVEKSLFLISHDANNSINQFSWLVRPKNTEEIAWITPPRTHIMHKWVLTPPRPFAHYPSMTQTIDLLESFSSNEKLYLFLCIKWAKGPFRFKFRWYHLELSFGNRSVYIALHDTWTSWVVVFQ